MQGFSDARLGELTGATEEAVRAARKAAGVTAVYKRIDTCAGEFPSNTPYMYAAYENGHQGADGPLPPQCEANPSTRTKVMILGGGPNRIGQGRPEEHTSELQSLMRISYAVFCLKKKIKVSHSRSRQQPTQQKNQNSK